MVPARLEQMCAGDDGIPSGPGDRANSPSRDHANIRHASRGPDGLRQLLPELKLR